MPCQLHLSPHQELRLLEGEAASRHMKHRLQSPRDSLTVKRHTDISDGQGLTAIFGQSDRPNRIPEESGCTLSSCCLSMNCPPEVTGLGLVQWGMHQPKEHPQF